MQRTRLFACLLLLVSLAWMAGVTHSQPPANPPDAPKAKQLDPITLRGRIVWLSEALKRLHGVESDADAEKNVLVLETADGKLYPLVKDFRGRGFFKDPRLLKFDYELEVRPFAGTQDVQVIRVFTLHDGQKFELDYWCDICAIPMFELKECECCQGPIRLRETPVGPANP